MPATLFICGMPGSGKSAMGKRLSNRLLWRFYDLDDFIKIQSGSDPATLINTLGETAFRSIEAEALRAVPRDQPLIISCGGGTPCFHENLAWMKTQGDVLFIDMPLISLQQRILQSDGLQKRPLLGNSPAEVLLKLEQTWLKREPFFKQIDWWENGLSLKVSHLEAEVKRRMNL